MKKEGMTRQWEYIVLMSPKMRNIFDAEAFENGMEEAAPKTV